MTLEQLREEFKKVSFPETIQDSLELIDLYADCFINLIHDHHRTVYKARVENEAKLVAQMIFSKVLNIKQIINGVSFIAKSGIKLNKIIDPTVIACLIRNVYETVAMFNLIFRHAKSGDERIILYNLWAIAGLKYRQRFSTVIRTKENFEKLKKEKTRAEQMVNEIHCSTLYKNLNDKNREKINTKIKEKDFLIEFCDTNVNFLSWQDLSKTMGVKDNKFDLMYNYFSLYAHPSNVAVFQFGEMFEKESDFTELSNFNLKYLFFLSGIFIADYISLFPENQVLFNNLPLMSQLVINSHNTLVRGYDYSINDTWKTLG